MKNYILAADLHIRSNRPRFRKDSYFRTVCWKFKQIIQIANKYNAHLIIAGDFFDSTKVGHKVVNIILRYVQRLEGCIFCVAGQHDQVYQAKDLKGSPLYTLILSGKVILLNNEAYWNDGKYHIYGCSFGDEPIVPKTENNVLVIHKSITPKEPPFYLPNAYSAEQALNKWEDYSIIVSGDFHEPFIKKKKERTLVNCGPMMRQSIDQADIEPSVWVFNTEKESIKRLKLRFDLPEEVFAFEDIKNKESKFAENLNELVETLKSEKTRPDYKQNVQLLMNSSKVSDNTRKKINDIIGSVDNE